MKSKILFICCFILLLCGCSKKEDTKTEELLTNNDIGFTIIVEDGRGITKDSKINHIVLQVKVLFLKRLQKKKK